MRRSFSLAVHSAVAAVSVSTLLLLALPSTSYALKSHRSGHGTVGTKLSKQRAAVDADGEERSEKYPTARVLGQSGDGSGRNDRAADAGAADAEAADAEAADAGAADKGATDKGATDKGAGNGNSNNNQHNGHSNKNQHNGHHSGSNGNANQKNSQHNANGNAGKHNGHQGGSNGQHNGKGNSNNQNGQHDDDGSGKNSQHSNQKNGEHNADGNAGKHNGHHGGGNGDANQADDQHSGQIDGQDNNKGSSNSHKGQPDDNGSGQHSDQHDGEHVNGTSWWNNQKWQHLGIGNGNQHGGMHFGNNSLGAHIEQYMDQHKRPSGNFWGGKGNSILGNHKGRHDGDGRADGGAGSDDVDEMGDVEDGIDPEDDRGEVPAATLAESESAESSVGSGGLIVFAVVSGVGVFIAAIRVYLTRNHPSKARIVEGCPPTELEDEADAATGDTEGEFVLPNVEFV